MTQDGPSSQPLALALPEALFPTWGHTQLQGSGHGQLPSGSPLPLGASRDLNCRNILATWGSAPCTGVHSHGNGFNLASVSQPSSLQLLLTVSPV